MSNLLSEWRLIRERLQPPPQHWDDGIDSERLLHMLFSVAHDPNPRLASEGAPYVRTRCRECHKQMSHSRMPLEFRLSYISPLVESIGGIVVD
jgi:hypothetical protein